MRTFLFRGTLALAVLLTLAAAPALAQSIVRGKVVDAQNKPVDGATISIESVDTGRKVQTKTDKKGEFMQIGLQTGNYKVTASKDKVGTDTKPARISQGSPTELAFTLAPAGAAAPDNKEAAAIQAAAQAGVDALNAGNYDEAIAKFNEVVAKVPTCGDCYAHIGSAYMAKKQYDDAETAFKKSVEIKPSADAYNGLANLYNTQKKFDLAADASSKAAQLSAGTPGGGGAEASYNQGVIFFNSQKFADAKTAFEAAVKADPNMALAHYQLGMTALNLGQIPQAVESLQTYLKLDPNGPKAAEVKAALPALEQMVKK
ncbi:MAG TPA: tetratricopeptide repeat protein [Vicinamibacterales bacterium]|nr:tetratricopeptide repeat protein [Vicinamibacterales bacterium]